MHIYDDVVYANIEFYHINTHLFLDLAAGVTLLATGKVLHFV